MNSVAIGSNHSDWPIRFYFMNWYWSNMILCDKSFVFVDIGKEYFTLMLTNLALNSLVVIGSDYLGLLTESGKVVYSSKSQK